jgi:nicotinamide-nucleotide amidase
MQELSGPAGEVAALLKTRGETLAVAESSAGGLISAALLAVPGASAFFLGGAVIYTRQARRVLLDITEETLAEAKIRPASEPYALLLARTVRQRFSSGWGVAETGATGPTGNRYGDPAGHACIAISGPVERVMTIETGHGDRLVNMREFAKAALILLRDGAA